MSKAKVSQTSLEGVDGEDIRQALGELAMRGNFFARKTAELLKNRDYLFSLSRGKVIRAIRKESLAGDLEIQTVYAWLCLLGLFVERDLEKAFALAQESYAKNNLEAAYLLGVCHANGFGTPSDSRKASLYLEEAIKGGVTDADLFLAVIMVSAPDLKPEDGFALLNAAAERGDSFAMCLLFSLFESGLIGNFIDEDGAVLWLEKAAATEFPEAVISLARVYYDGDLVDKNYVKAYKTYSKALKFKAYDGEIHYALGKMNQYGNGIPVNKELAKMYLKQSADKTYSPGMFDYGLLLYENNEKFGDEETGLKYILRAGERGNETARRFFGRALANDDSISKNHRLYPWVLLVNRDENDDPDDLYVLGCLYENGVSVNKNIMKAFSIFLDSANAGNRIAMYKVAFTYLYSNEIEIDMDLHNYWLKKAADANYPLAQYKLAFLYLKRSTLFSEQLKKVETYLTMACDNNFPKAFGMLSFLYITKTLKSPSAKKVLSVINRGIELEDDSCYACLGKMYLEGRGVKKSVEQGLNYLDLAKRKGSLLSYYFLSERYDETGESPPPEDEENFEILSDKEVIFNNEYHGDYEEKFKSSMLNVSSDSIKVTFIPAEMKK
ncbi:MAG: SEL1-like repeat protein [Deltaproteobacteria bacterium]|nr:SEL1-like repeat protein [Deltaproteobacteria bacterium]